MGLLRTIHPVLEHINYSETSSKLTLTLISLVFSISLYIMSEVLSNISSTYTNLTTKEQMFWNSAIVRSFYGVFFTIFCTWGMLFDDELETNVIINTSPETFVLCLVTFGFFIFECLVLTISDIRYKKFSTLLQIHHWMSLFVCMLAVTHERLYFFSYRFLILEMSAPFSSVCWILLKAGKGHTVFWKINQFLLVHVFHLRSFFEFSLCYYTLIKYRDVLILELSTLTLVLGYTHLILLTFVLTPYWTYKKTIQLLEPKDFKFSESERTRQTNGHAGKKML